MHFSRPVVAVALALALPACAAFAAGLPDTDAVPTRTLAATERVASAGIAPSLPDEPDTVLPYTQMPFWLINVNVGTLEPERPVGAERAGPGVDIDQPPYNAVR